jgi:hypothetical protein
MTRNPGHRKCTSYLWPGPGGLPLAARLSKGLASHGLELMSVMLYRRVLNYYRQEMY